MTGNRPARWLLAGILFSLAPVLPARADASAATLAAALEQAWARHPQAAALSAREAEAGARRELAEGLTPGPVSLSLDYLSDGLTSNRGRREWEIEMATPLWLPGQKAARQDEAAGAAAQVAARGNALRLEIAGEVREAWWAVAAARNELDLARRRVESAHALEADVLRRYRAGDLARVDANLVQGERLAAQVEAAAAQSALLRAEQAWRNLTGTTAPALLAGEDAAPASEPAEDHPRIVAAAAAARAAQARLKIAEVSLRDAPELALRLVRDRDDSAESYADTLGVHFRLPFSSGARVRVDNAAARAELAEADAALALARLNLRRDAERARADREAGERQLAMARERRELAADNLRLAEKAFSLGESDLTTLLRIRATAFEAEAFLNRQQVAYAAALSRLNQAMGVLP